MKKIGILVKNLTSGGAEKQSVLLAMVLAKDFEIHYIVFNGHKIHPKYLLYLQNDDRINIHCIKGNPLIRIILLYKYLRAKQIDAIFSYLTMANFIASTVGRLSGCKKIFTGLRNARLPFFKFQIDKFICNHLATIAISNSFSGKEHFVNKGFKKEKIIVIPNCYEEQKRIITRKLHDSIRIVTVGRFVKQKDYQTAICAIASLKNKEKIQFIIIGYGELENQIRRWVQKAGIESITEIIINPSNIYSILDNADIYLSTSLFEGTSNAIMEGMDANLPIVCTNVGDNKHLVQNDLNGYVCKVRDYKNISKCLQNLINDKNKRISFGLQSKKILSSNYNIDKFRERYLYILHQFRN